MIVLNRITRRDVTTEYLKWIKGEITNAEFEEIAGIPRELDSEKR